jgi:hypothetical protein
MPVQVDFEDDKRFVVLQGADLVAGRQRLLAENDSELPAFVGDLLSRISVSRYVCNISDEDMEALHAHTVKFINDRNESVT